MLTYTKLNSLLKQNKMKTTKIDMSNLNEENPFKVAEWVEVGSKSELEFLETLDTFVWNSMSKQGLCEYIEDRIKYLKEINHKQNEKTNTND